MSSIAFQEASAIHAVIDAEFDKLAGADCDGLSTAERMELAERHVRQQRRQSALLHEIMTAWWPMPRLRSWGVR
jgi:hypothetical protein